MKLFNVISRFFHDKLGKRDINDRLRSIMQKFDEVVIPMVDKVGTAMGQKDPSSTYVKTFLKEFHTTLPSNMRIRQKNMYFAILKRSVENARQLLTLIESVVNKELPETVYINGITYQKATLLRLIELLDFNADYVSRQLCYYVASETDVDAFGKEPGHLPFTKKEAASLVSLQSSFFKTVELFYQEPKQVMTQIGKIPEVLITGNEKVDLPAASAKDIDPLELGVIPLVTSLFQFVGETRVDWEHARYERVKKEKRDIELRLEVLRQRSRGQMDARLEATIEGYNRELTLLRDRIENYERKVR